MTSMDNDDMHMPNLEQLRNRDQQLNTPDTSMTSIEQVMNNNDQVMESIDKLRNTWTKKGMTSVDKGKKRTGNCMKSKASQTQWLHTTSYDNNGTKNETHRKGINKQGRVSRKLYKSSDKEWDAQTKLWQAMNKQRHTLGKLDTHWTTYEQQTRSNEQHWTHSGQKQ